MTWSTRDTRGGMHSISINDFSHAVVVRIRLADRRSCQLVACNLVRGEKFFIPLTKGLRKGRSSAQCATKDCFLNGGSFLSREDRERVGHTE